MSRDKEELVMKALISTVNPKIPEVIEKLFKHEGLSFGEATEAIYALWKPGRVGAFGA